MTRRRAPARPAPRRRAAGFVLPVTVILLALVAVGVALIAQRSDQMRALAIAARQEQAAAADAGAGVAQALTLLATRHRRTSRLGVIELDGRYYRSGNVMIAFQDAAALFNLRRAPRHEVARLLMALDVEPALADRLADTLDDYADADSLHALNGAEAPEYATAGLPAPRNARLSMPAELRRVMGWHELPPAQFRALLEHVYVGPTRNVNRYTVKAAVVAAMTGAPMALASDLVAQRAPGMPLQLESLPDVAGGSFLALTRYITVPSATTLVTVCPTAVSWCEHLSVTATSDSRHGPWRIDYAFRLGRTTALPPPGETPALPLEAPPPPPPMFNPIGVVPN